MEANVDARKAENYRHKWVEDRVRADLGDSAPRYSELATLMHRATGEAAAQALEAGHSPNEHAARYGQTEFDRYLDAAVQPIESIRWSFPQSERGKDGRVWSHRSFLLSDVRGRLVPEFQRYDIEQIAGRYIKSDVKTSTVDRLLVDILVAMEFAQFADSQINAPHVPMLAPSLLKRRPVVEWFVGRVVSGVFGVVGVGFFWGLSVLGWFPESWLWLVGLIFSGLFLMDATWATVALPRVWLAVRAGKKNVASLLDHMNGTYAALVSEGPVSAAHVTELVNRGSAAGIVWPGPLHVLLEDITARGGRF